MKDPIQIVIIGTGMVSRQHVQAINEIDGALLYGIFDVNADMAEKKAAELGVRAFSSKEEIWNSEADLVSICTPSGTHFDLVMEALEHGKHAVVEKPMAMTYDECCRIMEAEKKYGRICAPISQHRFSNDILLVRQLLEDEKLGKIIYAGTTIQYHRTAEYYSASPWRGSIKMDGGVLMNQGIHGIDCLSFLMGYPEEISGFCGTLYHQIEAEDSAVAILRYPNGVLGSIIGTTASSPGAPRRTEICGTKGTVIFEEDIISFIDDSILKHAQEKVTGGFSDPAAITALGHTKQYRNIIAALHGEEELFYHSSEAAKTIRLITDIIQSSRENTIITHK